MNKVSISNTEPLTLLSVIRENKEYGSVVVNGRIAIHLMYLIDNIFHSTINHDGSIYLLGVLEGMQVWVDPQILFSDLTMLFFEDILDYGKC